MTDPPLPFDPRMRISVVIPALNEERAIAQVLSETPRWVNEVVVADNGSTDRTAELARRHGARVVHEPRRGYGRACLAAIAALDRPDVIVFLDGDAADDPRVMDRLVRPIAGGEADFVLGSRATGEAEPGSLTLAQRWGNRLACRLLRRFFGTRYTDLGPFRAIRAGALRALGMDDENYGWTIQMQARAARHGLRTREVPVPYRRRIGRSKVSGTVRGVVGAGTKIVYTVFRELRYRPRPPVLIVLTRYPAPGRTKTRLIPRLGARGAADLHRELTALTLSRADRLGGVAVEVHYTGGTERQIRRRYGAREYHEQADGDLGRRMNHAIDSALRRGAPAVVLIGTDAPGLTTEILRDAFGTLDDHDLVLGPAADGGYYLVGLNRPAPSIFEGIDWGTATVRAQTLRRAADTDLSVRLLDELIDIDTPGDLPEWERWRGGS